MLKTIAVDVESVFSRELWAAVWMLENERRGVRPRVFIDWLVRTRRSDVG